MADKGTSLKPPTLDQRRAAVGQFERANQVIATGNYDYGIQLLLACCKLDPANLIYRQKLRQTEKEKYGNKGKGKALASLTTAGARLRARAALRSADYLKALECAEEILVSNPWDVGAQRAMAEAFDGLDLVNAAVWCLEQARQASAKDQELNKQLARMYEKRGNFTHAAALWEQVRKADPTDVEAQRKAKDLAASETIARGGYEQALAGTAEQAAAGTSEHPKLGAEKADPQATPDGQPAAPVDRVGRAADPIRQKIAAEPTNPHHYLQLANMYRRAEQHDRAREVLEQALGPTGNCFEIAIEVAQMAIEPFRADLAVTEEKLRAKPKDEELRTLRRNLLKEINARELDLYRQKSTRNPTDMSHRFEMGVRLYRLGQLDEAIRELQTARTDPRQLWRALMYLGHCFKARHNWKLAQRNYEEALNQLPPTEPDTRKDLLFHLATGIAEAGDLPRAIELGEELANLDFGYKDIGKLLDEWQVKQQANRSDG